MHALAAQMMKENFEQT